MLTSFLEEAKVKRFSLCFNSGADGVLIALDGWMTKEPPRRADRNLIDPPNEKMIKDVDKEFLIASEPGTLFWFQEKGHITSLALLFLICLCLLEIGASSGPACLLEVFWPWTMLRQ